MFLLLVGFAELAAQAIYFVGYGAAYSARDLSTLALARELPAVAELEQGNLPRRSRENVLHPFLGYVHRADERTSGSHGFPNVDNPLPRREDGKRIIGVFGGSVAEQLAPYIERAFSDDAVETVVLNLAIGGYKQPQQLLALSYLTALGAEFDVVVNVDGFNELALSIDENHRNGVYPFFPRAWGARVGIEKSSRNMVLAGKIKFLRDHEQGLYRRIESDSLRWSAIYGLFRRYQLARLLSEIDRAHARLLESKDVRYDFERSGPAYGPIGFQELLTDIADSWSASSVTMQAVANAAGADYHHFLQPNQYLPGSKTLTDAERSLPNHPREEYARIVSLGYPLLIEHGAELAGRGVPFHDTSKIFADRPDTIYRDACCHYNELGNQILAAYVHDRIVKREEGSGLTFQQ